MMAAGHVSRTSLVRNGTTRLRWVKRARGSREGERLLLLRRVGMQQGAAASGMGLAGRGCLRSPPWLIPKGGGGVAALSTAQRTLGGDMGTSGVEEFVGKGYPFADIEDKWQRKWEEQQTFCTPNKIDVSKPKFYALDMFPYPSGAGLHVGHPEGYTATDIVSRYKRMKGYNVLHPMGWDAFGLPAEQYALQTGTHPRDTTAKNIGRFKEQLQRLGFSYDWSREISTTDPKYYKWTQWIFLKLLENDLAYQEKVPVNWCPALGTVLANEEVIDGKSERGGHPVERKAMKQWMLKITSYADRLLNDLDDVDWPESVKEMQRNWIGRSEGAMMSFQVCDGKGQAVGYDFEVFTTRPDTICGATFVVLAPEHNLVHSITSSEQRVEVEAYVKAAASKSDLERTELQKHKSGVRTGAFALNPATNEPIPIFIADYVLGGYGSGAIMAVPAHDERDFDFATTYDVPIVRVVSSEETDELPYVGPGKLVNSANTSTGLNLDGRNVQDAKVAAIEWLKETGVGKPKVNFKLRDWLFARQRYWGEPFPVVYTKDSSDIIPMQESDLPLALPDMETFEPSGTGESPLANNRAWVETTTRDGEPALRDTNTMPQWAGSCWYYLRFIDPSNDEALVGSDLEKYWMPVDLYVGGAEHSVLHLLYARFWHKVLYDLGVVSTKEPFQRLVNQGMILGEIEYTGYKNSDGEWVSADKVDEYEYDLESVSLSEADVAERKGGGFLLAGDDRIAISGRAYKMSKSRGNVINPDDIVNNFGADSLRLYEMFMGPLRDTKTWNTRGVEGVYRFLGRTWRLFTNKAIDVDVEPTREQWKALHECIKRVTTETEEMRYNTAIAAMMEYVNAATKWENRPRLAMEPMLLLLAPYAPHIAEELWERLGHSTTLTYERWPEHKEEYLMDDTMKIPVQVNGKMKGLVEISKEAGEDDIMAAAMGLPTVSKMVGGKEIKKRIYVPGRIVNLIVGK